jgi:uncharacterized protein (TIGR02001 family)
MFSIALATPALAQDAPAEPITVSAEVALVSDYRFRGVSQSDGQMAIQGGASVAHESGFYVGTWTSSLSGWGTFGGGNMELDIFGGYTASLGAATVDVGLTWYMYPGGANTTDFAEAYLTVSSDVGPVNLLGGIAYAPKQEALGNFSNTPQSRGQKQDNLYLWGDVTAALPTTPITLKAHVGYSDGNPGLGPNGTSVAPTGKYLDWSVGADYALGPVTLGISYVDTDISRSEAASIPGFATSDGSAIANGRVVFSATAAF